ncbi:MAG: protoporphyrinogen/coproporphyrinogen oxidase [Bacteroidia bacterium]
MGNKKVENLIVGAGPAGIAAALSLGKSAVIIDRNKEAGGQSGSIEIGEAVFDIGGHSFHTPHPFVRDLVYNSLEMYDQKRNATCYSFDKLIPYPFQKNFRELNDSNIVKECSEGLLSINSENDAGNFEEFILNRFGPGISEHFMLPYNQKLWARDLKQLDAKWVGERVAAPEGVNEKFDTSGGRRKPLQANTVVGYPAKGGFGEIYKALAKKTHRIDYGVEALQIDIKSKKVFTNVGTYEYDNLISTMPINEFIGIIDNPDQDVLSKVNTLETMSLKCILVAINHPVDTEIQRIYNADNTLPAHKTAINHNSSQWLRERKHHGIMGEVAYSKYKQFPRLDLEEWFIDGLLKTDVIKDKNEILKVKTIDVKYAYPVPSHNRREIMGLVSSYLNDHDVYSLGRFGEWAYINSDEALARGIVLGEKLAGSY